MHAVCLSNGCAGSASDWKSTLRANQMALPSQSRTTQGESRPVLRDAFLIPYIVMDQGTERAVVYLVMDAVAGARRTPGRQKTGGVPPKPPATFPLSLTLWPSMFWDFGSLYHRRCGVISHTLSRKLHFSSMSLRRLRLRVAAQANRTSRKVDELAAQNFLMDVLGIVTGAHMFWDFGSLCKTRCGVFSADCCGSGNLFSELMRHPLCLLLWQQQSTTAETLRRPLCHVAASAVDITASSLTQIGHSRAHGKV